jgi:hypothetical protein
MLLSPSQKKMNTFKPLKPADNETLILAYNTTYAYKVPETIQWFREGESGKYFCRWKNVDRSLHSIFVTEEDLAPVLEKIRKTMEASPRKPCTGDIQLCLYKFDELACRKLQQAIKTWSEEHKMICPSFVEGVKLAQRHELGVIVVSSKAHFSATDALGYGDYITCYEAGQTLDELMNGILLKTAHKRITTTKERDCARCSGSGGGVDPMGGEDWCFDCCGSGIKGLPWLEQEIDRIWPEGV